MNLYTHYLKSLDYMFTYQLTVHELCLTVSCLNLYICSGLISMCPADTYGNIYSDPS